MKAIDAGWPYTDLPDLAHQLALDSVELGFDGVLLRSPDQAAFAIRIFGARDRAEDG